MTDILEIPANTAITPQCHYFVVRKKRLCRMTVRPGRQYCGEHEPKPKTNDGQEDTRIPCPYDPKHTVYASKLEKHLSICNAKQTEFPPFIIQNINAPRDVEACVRRPLSKIPRETIMRVIDKVNSLYAKHIEGNISEVPEQPIHAAVMEEFCEGDRTESSRRHMRQASSILHLAEKAGLVHDQTCYVELGAGKGQLSYYMGTAWCDDLTDSSVVVIDRAALRHKRDNKLRTGVERIRADLAHLALAKVERISEAKAVVGFAKHLCGVATDFALRCVSADSILPQTCGIVLATCCHHRCEHAQYIAHKHLQELGINGEEFNTMLGIVSWATCGDGRSRDRRRQLVQQGNTDNPNEITHQEKNNENLDNSNSQGESKDEKDHKQNGLPNNDENSEKQDRRQHIKQGNHDNPNEPMYQEKNDENLNNSNIPNGENKEQNGVTNDDENIEKQDSQNNDSQIENKQELNIEEPNRNIGDAKWREEVGRRAKALLDWGRVLYLREKGFDAHLCHYVPATVSLENVCIVATKLGR